MRCAAGVLSGLAGSVRVEVAFTAAGFEVARIYGVLAPIMEAAAAVYRDLPPSGGNLPGRVASGRYSVVVVAPASANTVAKLRHGVADNPVVSAAAQAIKNRIPLVLLPSDHKLYMETELPCVVDKDACNGCGACISSCPAGAIVVEDGAVRIDYGKCIGCGKCRAACPSGAVTCWRRVVVECSPIDVENAWVLSRLDNVKVVTSCVELGEEIRRLLGIPPGEAGRRVARHPRSTG